MENTKEIVTPNGYIATIKSFITFGEYNKIQSSVTSGVNFKLKDADGGSISGDVLMAAQKTALNICLIELFDPKKVKLENPQEAINDLPFPDGQCIMDAINSVTGQAQQDKKKEIQ